MKAILASIYLAIAAVRGAFAIKKIVDNGEGTVPEKVADIAAELAKVTDKLKTLAKETPATWDDTFAEAIYEILVVIAEDLVDQLEG